MHLSLPFNTIYLNPILNNNLEEPDNLFFNYLFICFFILYLVFSNKIIY